ncbi:hypothetical protein OG444_38750 [Streptomyces sp. NBC_01232]|uniref:zinc finger domain-containing protein n=1 Tax=Streptomyces sp. NBC_01232 TaxID=2903786 RepID=UPI002E0EB4C9|nr:hypothetical protein OG444_38750 [Streptomyces sp. NBC_01232]
MTTWFPPLSEYAFARGCPRCGAGPGEPCIAPRKNARLARADHAGVDDEARRMHAPRLDAAIRHYHRDVGKAPLPDARVPGRRYDSLNPASAPRSARAEAAVAVRPPVVRPLADRAAAVFGRESGRVRWPYGMQPPAPPRTRTDEALARYEAALAQRRAAQEQITTWAESLGLRHSQFGCCPRWLQRQRSSRCRPWACTQYGGSGPDHDWLDHLLAWTRRGKPAAITSAPYSVGAQDAARLTWWTGEDPRLSFGLGTGWYGSGTTQIVMWRTDLVAAAPLTADGPDTGPDTGPQRAAPTADVI